MENSKKLFISFSVLILVVLIGVSVFKDGIFDQSARGLDADLSNQRGGGQSTATPSTTEKVILLGGVKHSGGSYNDVWVSNDLDINDWTMLTNNPSWSSNSTPKTEAVYFNNKIWVLNDDNFSASEIYYSSDGINWSTYSNLSFPARAGATFITFDDGNGEALWIIGGSGPATGGPVNDVWKSYDGQNWIQVIQNAPWQERADHSSVVFNGKIWVIGGVTLPTAYLQDVWSSPDGINWTQDTINGPWGPRARHDSVVYDGKIWIFGGSINNAPGSTGTFDAWSSPDGTNWTLTSSGAAPYTTDRVFLKSIVFENRMWIIGGRSGAANMSYNDTYSSYDGITWTPSSPVIAPFLERSHHDIVVVPISFGSCQIEIGVNPPSLPSTSLLIGNQVISKFELTGCVDDSDLQLIEVEYNQTTAQPDAFRVENPILTDTSTGNTAILMEQTVNRMIFKVPGNINIPANITKIFEITADINSDPSLLTINDTLSTRIVNMEVFVPISSQQAVINPILPTIFQFLTY